MSKVGKKPIVIPEKVKVNKEDDSLVITGPLGELKLNIPNDIEVVVEENIIKVKPRKINKLTKKLWGTIRSLINNAVLGVIQGYEKKLIIEGLGYQAQVNGNNLILKIGYTHPVSLKIPENLKVKVDKNIISVWGIDKQKVGNFAAIVRKQKPPEPYHGKGIRYENEIIKKKAGKKA